MVTNDNTEPNDWKELCYLWSSDFRTHITEKRWNDHFGRLDNQLANCNSKDIQKSRVITNNVEIGEDEKWIKAENYNYKVVLNKSKGLTVNKLIIKKFGNESLLGTLDHGYYDDISLGADYYSGHAVIERPGEHKITDLGKINSEIIESERNVSINTRQEWVNYIFKNNIIFEDDKLIFSKSIESLTNDKAVIRPFSYTFNPDVWDKDSLYIKTNNGGPSFEKFYLSGQNISHGDIYSSLISARHGFGNTEGVFIIGDKDKSIFFECYMSISALIPSIIYEEMGDSYFFRLQYSTRELDETVKKTNHKYTTKISISFDKL